MAFKKIASLLTGATFALALSLSAMAQTQSTTTTTSQDNTMAPQTQSTTTTTSQDQPQTSQTTHTTTKTKHHHQKTTTDSTNHFDNTGADRPVLPLRLQRSGCTAAVELHHYDDHQQSSVTFVRFTSNNPPTLLR